jgi:adenylate cyclase class IV
MMYREIEFKYNAEDIPLNKFKEFCEGRPNLHRYLHISGYDHFFHNTKSDDSFCRLRISADQNQLTFKRKTVSTNSYMRTEHNIDLLPTVTQDQIQALCAEFGYKHNTSIFKACFVYKYDYYTLVYYICYNLEMKEAGRYIEIEMDEDYKWSNEDHAWGELVTMERLCRPLGINAQGRIKRSLFELFKK